MRLIQNNIAANLLLHAQSTECGHRNAPVESLGYIVKLYIQINSINFHSTRTMAHATSALIILCARVQATCSHPSRRAVTGEGLFLLNLFLLLQRARRNYIPSRSSIVSRSGSETAKIGRVRCLWKKHRRPHRQHESHPRIQFQKTICRFQFTGRT